MNSNEKKQKQNEVRLEIFLGIVGYIIIISFTICFHKFFNNIITGKIINLSIIFNILFPLCLYTYYIVYHYYHSNTNTISYEKQLEEIKLELEQEGKISTIIPVILFGIGAIYTTLQKLTKNTLLKIATPYLIFSLLFGTIIPIIISYLILDHNDLDRINIASHLDFVFVSMAFGLIITSLLIPFLILY
jgi:hypothetical protein